MRTEYCGSTDTRFLGQTVTLYGWSHRRRDHGGVIFIDLRDREGLVQVVCDPDRKETFAAADSVRNEFVLRVTGLVRRRPEGTVNADLKSGDIDVLAHEIEILNASATPPFLMDDDRPKVIHVGYQPATVEQVWFPQAEVVGDMGRSLALLADRLEGRLPNAGALLPLREGILAHLAERATEERWTPQRIVHDVRKVMPADGIVALDNGMYKIWFARNYRTRNANTLLLDNALATMGAGLPSAIMAAMLYPKRRVLAVCGDGGFMMNSQELETAVRLKLDLVVLVLVDSAFGMIRWKQAVDGFADFGMTFGNPDFALYAQAYGAEGHRLTEIGDFVPTLEAAFDAGGVHLVAVPIDYSENKRVLVDELRDRQKSVTGR